jgi:branched-chain amino acid transport system permease protein
LIEVMRMTARTAHRVQRGTQTTPVFAGIGILILLVLGFLPLVASRALIQDLFGVFTLLALAECWNLLAGLAGLVSVGQQAFVGLGAYLLFAGTSLLGLDAILSVLLAGLVTMVAAIPTSFIVFRLRGAYFAIGTWVVAEVYRLGFAQVKSLGGGTGMSLPRSATGDVYLVQLTASVLGLRGPAARDVLDYWLALLLVAAVIASVYAILRSRRGLALSAIRDNEGAAGSVGVDAFRMKLWVYLAASLGTGLTGALIYLAKARISPDAAFSVQDWTANVIFVVVIGGIGTIEGPILGVGVFYALETQLSGYGGWYLMLLGAIAVAVMRFFPRGLWGTLAARFDLALFPVRRRLLIADRPNTTSPSKGENP